MKTPHHVKDPIQVTSLTFTLFILSFAVTYHKMPYLCCSIQFRNNNNRMDGKENSVPEALMQYTQNFDYIEDVLEEEGESDMSSENNRL